MKAFAIVLLAVALALSVSVVSTYKKIISKDDAVNAGWEQVAKQIQARNERVPDLISKIKVYASNERSAFEGVDSAFSQWENVTTTEAKINTASNIDKSLARLIFVAEGYPNLKADQEFRMRIDQLIGAENCIAIERMRYNDLVQDYNILIKGFPGNRIAAILGFKIAQEYFKIESGTSVVSE